MLIVFAAPENVRISAPAPPTTVPDVTAAAAKNESIPEPPVTLSAVPKLMVSLLAPPVIVSAPVPPVMLTVAPEPNTVERSTAVAVAAE